MAVEAARASDLIGIQQLLLSAQLPVADLTPEMLMHFVVVRDGMALKAIGGLEWNDGSAMLRSVAVDSKARRSGVGGELVRALEDRAQQAGAPSLYLLTTTADDYFEKRGYRSISRDQAPAGIRNTAQFEGLCPASSTFMVKTLEPKPFNVLFLCTGNSARSILAEAILNEPSVSRGRFRAYSAGSHPKGEPNPYSLELLQSNQVSTEQLRSKSWDEFAQPGAPVLDFVFTVCDQAAGEPCPFWPGQPVTAHWGVPDPAAVEGDDELKRKAFLQAYMVLRRRIDLFTVLPLASIERMSLQKQLNEIGTQ